MDFTKKLLKWDKEANTRVMPWKGEKDPFKIWLSEIILQQTRVEQGWAYYEKFLSVFPDIHQLAKAPEKNIFKLWEGLGYYSRCRNLIETAKKIVKKYQGKFPTSYDEIKELKGVGPYTAAAIASFAFNLPHAVVDGNVERILARYFGVTTPTDTNAGKKFYSALALALLDKKEAGRYNQAIMDFGAVICKPKNPQCMLCPQRKECMAFKNGWVGSLPVKSKAIERKKRFFYYFIIETNNGVYIRKRVQKDIWKNLYEFVLWETGKLMPHQETSLIDFLKLFLKSKNFAITGISNIYKQQLTHQTIEGRFIKVNIEKPVSTLKGYTLIKKSKLKEYPFPKYITGYLQNPV